MCLNSGPQKTAFRFFNQNRKDETISGFNRHGHESLIKWWAKHISLFTTTLN